MVDRDEAALKALRMQPATAVIALVDRPGRPKDCADVVPRFEQAASSTSCTPMPASMSAATSSRATRGDHRMLNLNVNV